ncbi:S8 family serine peptidase [Massilia agilis]|uniref:S8 family serine peptidase n=1 Tax=Massilia agilis TaxID=1811226 RepID=A0ABT2DGK2_9BURK|nr:S8 family serine peptidase [Massilia agilis]MCS0809556.1 S8 family serine peptidase [Massilia agilis]
MTASAGGASLNFQPLTASILSTDSGSPSQFTLANHSNQVLQVFWIDRAGTEQLYGEVQPGASFNQPTFSSHAWEIKSKDGAIGFKFFATVAGAIDVTGSGTPGFTDFSERIIHTAQGDWSTAEGYGVINVAKSLGVPDLGYTLPLNAQGNNLALDVISASSAWTAGITGKGVKVAVIDSGIASNSEVNASIVGGYDFFDNDTNPAPDNGNYRDHSLGVAAIIAASHAPHAGQDAMGVAPDAQLLNVRVGSSNGSPSTNIASGIRWAVDQGAKVICMPLQNNSASPDPVVADAVHYAYQHNVLTVIIGGNFSTYGATGLALIAKTGEALAVGNLDAMAATPFQSSNTPGATPFPWVMASSSGYLPNADGGYTYRADGGTSFAGPYVAGLAALLFQQSPNATVKDIIAKIIGGASISASAATAAAASGQTGTAMADRFVSTAANDSIDGKGGLDTVVFLGPRANYSIAQSGSQATVTDLTGKDGVDTLAGIERLAFTDKNVALDINGDAGQVYRLYQAAFGRVPDEGGLGYWISAKDGGMALVDIARQFMASKEAVDLYGASPSAEALVNSVYQNVLHRAPDQGGHDFWVDTMSRGLNSPATLVTAFSDSTENIANAAAIIGNGFAYTPLHG